MTFNLIRTTRLALLLIALANPLANTAQAADEAILLIDQTSGVAGVQRNGKRLALQPGDTLQEQDLIVTDRSGRMTLRLGRHGFVEVGPNAEVGVERLPFATYARDLKSIFSVSKGYFRVVWKHPQLSTNWPLYVYMAGHRVSLVSGEYFFQNLGAEQRACVAAGQLALQAAGGEGIETVKPPACVRLAANAAPQVQPRNPDDWIAVRRGYSIEATAATLLARDPAPAELPPPVVAKPIITTSPTPPVVAAAPTAIAPPPRPAGLDALDAAEPAVSTSAAARSDALGPVRAAPVLPAPVAAPPTAVAPALSVPAYEPPALPLPRAPVVARPAQPVVIGQVVQTPLAASETAPPAAKPAAPSAVKLMPPAPVALVPAGGSWALNIASYTESAVAEREAGRLRAAGYAVRVQAASINGKTWHRVQLPGFASEGAARTAASELKSRLGLQNIWVLKP